MATKKKFKPMDDEEFKEYLRKKMDGISDFVRSPTDPIATSEPDFERTVYKFDYPFRGLAVIFNNVNFKNQEPRTGSDVDENNLSEAFTLLGFTVIIFNDLTAAQMLQAAKIVASSCRHDEADCFACVLLSHGEQTHERVDQYGVKVVNHVLYGSDNQSITTKSIIEQFDNQRCPSLKNKPRLFFIQACRGGEYDDGVSRSAKSIKEDPTDTKPSSAKDRIDGLPGPDFTKKEMKVLSVPLYQDCLIMYATPPGYYAWRNLEAGSWFIQEICKRLKSPDVEHFSLLRVLTCVCRAVAMGHTSDTGENELSGKLEMPVIDTMLTKDIFMIPKDGQTFSLRRSNIN